MRSVVLASAVTTTLLVSPLAQADPHHPVIPSKQQVQSAQHRVASTKQSITQLRRELSTAQQRLQALYMAAENAGQRYDAAMVRWQQARQEAATARKQSLRANRQAGRARDTLAGYVVTHDTASSTLTALSTALTADGPQSLLSQLSVYDASSDVLDTHFQQWQASSRLAKVYAANAKQALERVTTAKAAASRAKAAAEAAAQQAQAGVTTLQAQRSTLVRRLASVEHISVQLAAQRQKGLEELRKQRLEEKRRREAAARRAAERRAAAKLAAERRAEARRAAAHRRAERAARERAAQQGGSSPAPTPPPPPPPPVYSPPPAGPSASQVQTAIAYAKAQLGKPYVWGGTGPYGYDCSGLVMEAWLAAGITLPRVADDQYLATTPISFDQLRPGDLVFWGYTSSPYSIHHVAMYLGGGMVIEAPHTGAYVQIRSIYSWILPNFYSRV